MRRSKLLYTWLGHGFSEQGTQQNQLICGVAYVA